MSLALRYLRASDVLQDIQEKRPKEIAKDYFPIFTGFFGAFTSYGIHEMISYGCNSFLAERTFELVSDALYLEYSFIYPIIGFAVGCAIPIMIDDGRIHISEKDAKNYLYKESKIIDKQTYDKLIKIMHPKISEDLETKFIVPDDHRIDSNGKTELDRIINEEKKLLNSMLYTISKGSMDNKKIYEHVLKKLGTKVPIVDFLILRTSLPDLNKIQDFAIQNNLKELQAHCKKFLEYS